MADPLTTQHVNPDADVAQDAQAQQHQQHQQQEEKKEEEEEEEEAKAKAKINMPHGKDGAKLLGPHVHLRARKPAELPRHTALEGQQHAQDAAPPSLRPFVEQILDEAAAFIEDMPRTFKVTGTTASAPSTARVEQLSRAVTSRECAAGSLPAGRAAETWFARRSRHVDARRDGTAEWAEFDEGLRVEHSAHEKEYTPDLYDARKVLDWDGQLKGEFASGGEGKYEDVSMSIYEMAHAMPFPLKPRVFATLVLSARTSPTSLLDVQLPVDLSATPAAYYSNGTHLRDGGATAQQKKRVVLGEYVSIERAMVLGQAEEGEEAEAAGEREIQWDMATASDAAGSLPMWAQKMGMPGAIVKDVGFFVEWARKRRAAGGS